MQDRVIVITGASSGIGAALAEVVVGRGANVVLAARRVDELAAVADRLGPRALAVVTDVTHRGQVERLRDEAVARFGHVDVWVNNAGRGISRSVTELTDEDLDAMMTINVKSVLYGIQAILPHFRSRGRGHLITVSSLLGRIGFAPPRAAYSAAKHAVNALMTSLRLELRPTDPEIHVSTFLPGVVATDFGNHALHGGIDSRVAHGAQPVGEVAEVLAELIAHPRAEVYSRPGYRDMMARYFAAEDVGVLEGQPPFTMPRVEPR
jgi:NADP-dependent 3-hydroxy acid dehydrogenase YdfG